MSAGVTPDRSDSADASPSAAASPEARGTPVATPTEDALRERFGATILRHEVVAGDEHVIFVEASRVVEILGWLRDEQGEAYNFLSDITAVDYGGGRPVQVVYQLFSLPHRRALRVKAELPVSDLRIESATGLWGAANWLEREVYDMFGVHFEGHPDLRRILMPQNYAEGHPLRKDFPLRGRFSREEQTQRALSHDPEDHYIPLELELGGQPQVVPWRETGGEAVPKSSSEQPSNPAEDEPGRRVSNGSEET